MLPKYKQCKDCGTRLSSRNQYPSCHRQNQKVCKKCWNERFYIAVRKHKYGLSKEQFLEKQTQQQNRCAICADHIEGRKICVDHDHATGAVRGLLCATCNFGIGGLRDSALLCMRAAEYLIHHNSMDRKPVGREHRASGRRAKMKEAAAVASS